MHYYSTEQVLYELLESLFTRLQRQPQLHEAFVHSNLVVRVRFRNPKAEVLLDGRQPPLGVFYGPSPGAANFEMCMEADKLHHILLKEEELTSALFDGSIQVKGNILKAQPFIELIQNCQQIYPFLV